jgi:hypothetical protein
MRKSNHLLDDMKPQPPEKLSASRLAGIGAFAVVIGLFMLISSKAGMQGIGVVMLVGTSFQLAT